MTSNIKDIFPNFDSQSLTRVAVGLVEQKSASWRGPLFSMAEGFSSDKSLANELFQWAANDYTWYKRWGTPIITNLKKHAAKGNYDPKTALKSWARGANAAADLYAKEFGGTGAKGKDMFPANIRKMVAIALEDEYREEATE